MKNLVQIPEGRLVELIEAERRLKSADVHSEAEALTEAQVYMLSERVSALEKQLTERDERITALTTQNAQLAKGRDDRQRERDKEREKVRKLKEELERTRASYAHDDIRGDLMRATVGEFRNLQNKVKTSSETIQKIYDTIRNSNVTQSHGDILDEISFVCECYFGQ